MFRICLKIIWQEEKDVWKCRWHRIVVKAGWWVYWDHYPILFLNDLKILQKKNQCFSEKKFIWKTLWLLCEDVMLGAAAATLWPWACKPEVKSIQIDSYLICINSSLLNWLIMKLNEKMRQFQWIKILKLEILNVHSWKFFDCN